MTFAAIVRAVESAAYSASCTAYLVESQGRSLHFFCVTPDDESATWAGNLEIRWCRKLGILGVSLEHSGPIGFKDFYANAEGLAALEAWLHRELR